MKTLAIISPCFNEEAVISDSCAELVQVLDDLKRSSKVSRDSFILLVDDGSSDATWDKIQEVSAKYPECRGIHLRSNVGHQNALMAGMMYVRDKVEAVITVDIDLQDDMLAVGQMVDLFNQGTDIVYGVKNDRHADSALKNFTARLFYKFQKKWVIRHFE